MNPLHNPYYTPLCKMDEVYGEGTVERLKAAKGPWEYFYGGRWIERTHKPFDMGVIYRLAPAIPMTVPWSSIAEGWDWAAATEYSAWVDNYDPCGDPHGADMPREGRAADITHLVGFSRGTVDWRDSLQRRPGK